MKRAITERMDQVELNIQNEFTNLDCKKDFLFLLRRAKKEPADRRPFTLSQVARMLKQMGQTCEFGKPVSYYEKKILALDIPDTADEINRRIIDVLNQAYADYPNPGEFMKRIVDGLDLDVFNTESLRLRILKRFMRTVNVKENAKYYSKALANCDAAEVDESVFRVLTEKQEEACDCVPLVQAAHNLANGNFVSPVTTKELLFLFAFAYDMRYYPSDNSADYEVQRDVEKNLFEDYYCDNLTRYIYLEDGGKKGNSDTEPSGMGLNPKNFIDVTFIYYLNQEELSASQKVSGFYTMIHRIKDDWKEKHSYVETLRGEYEKISTGTYRNRIDSEIVKMDTEAFVTYVLENYYCDVRYTYEHKKTGKIQEGSKGLFELQVALNSAYEQYNLILELIKEELYLPEKADFSKIDFRALKDTANEKSFNEQYLKESSVLANRFCELEMNVPDAGSGFFQKMFADGRLSKECLMIIQNIEKRLNPYDALTVTCAEDVTRTKMLAAYYHYHCLKYGLDDCGEDWQSFQYVFEEICYCLNKPLEDAGYQGISSKNLYDVFVIFFAYCKINNFLND